MSKHLVTTRSVPDELAARLLEAAGTLPMSFDDLGMREIARVTGVPRATLYYYFSGKDELIAFLLRAMLDDLRQSVAVALDSPGDVADQLRSVVQAQFAHLAANPATSQLLFMNLGKVERLQLIAEGVEASFHGPVRRLLHEGMRTGRVRQVDVEVTVTALYGAVTIVGLHALLRNGSLDATALTAATFPLFWSGVEAPPS